MLYFDTSLIRAFFMAAHIYFDTSVFWKSKVISVDLGFWKAFKSLEKSLKSFFLYIFPTRFCSDTFLFRHSIINFSIISIRWKSYLFSCSLIIIFFITIVVIIIMKLLIKSLLWLLLLKPVNYYSSANRVYC